MRRIAYFALTTAVFATPGFATLPGNAAEGQRLHAANCTGCHDSGVYTRKERTVRSLDELKQQLEGCSHLAKKEFSPAEMQSLVKFLDDKYYHFR